MLRLQLLMGDGMMAQEMKKYMGDAVYADFDGYHIVLTTEDGIKVSNTIFLEPSVFDALVKHRNAIAAAQKEGK